MDLRSVVGGDRRGTSHRHRFAFRVAHHGGFALLVALLSSMGGCSDDDATTNVRKAALAEGCLINTDCEDPLVCAYRRCHKQCADSRDCPAGQRCVISDRPGFVCQLEDERDCVYHSECPAPLLCAADAQCRNQCNHERDCVPGQVCVSGSCAEPAEVDSDGYLVGADRDGGEGQLCVYSSDCMNNLLCVDDYCRPECRGDVDCDAGFECVANRCVPEAPSGPDAGPPCVYKSDCVVLDPAFVCLNGVCRYECMTSVDCSPGSVCAENRCVPDADAGDAGDGGEAGDSGDAGDGGVVDASVGCIYNSDCVDAGTGFVCRSGACVPECKADIDCASGQACVGGRCLLKAPDGAPDGYGTACAIHSDCGPGLLCLFGLCSWECEGAIDCAGKGECCVDHRCASGSACDAADAGTTDAGCGCQSNEQCDDGLWCNGIERCIGGCCVPAQDTPCDSNTACIVDDCDEATQSCSHVTVAPTDQDGDGHLDLGCGGDDCDDDRDDVYAGAVETCDGVDNDCNGWVDDKSRTPYGPVGTGPEPATPPKANAGGWAVPTNDGVVVFYSYIQTNAARYEINVEYYDNAGVLQASLRSNHGGPNAPNIFAAAGGPTSALVLYRLASSTTPSTRVLVVGAGAPITTLAKREIVPAGQGSTNGDATWTGNAFFVGFGESTANGLRGQLQLIGADGSQQGGAVVPTPDLDGLYTGALRVAAGPSGLAAAYRLPDGRLFASTFGASLTMNAGPFEIPGAVVADTPAVLAIGGSAGGFILAWQSDAGTFATYFESDGTVGATRPIPSGPYTSARAGSDGDGAMFGLVQTDVSYFGYGRGDLTNPFEVGPLASGFNSHGLSADGTRAVASWWNATSDRVGWISAGCGP